MVKSNDCEQPKICEKIFENIDEKFKVANHRINDLENKTEEINSITNVLTELQLLTKLQREDGIKRDAMIIEMNENQTKISNSLDILTNKLNNTDNNVAELKDEIKGIKDDFKKSDEDNSIKIPQFIKYIVFTGSGTVIGIVATKFVSYLFK